MSKKSSLIAVFTCISLTVLLQGTVLSQQAAKTSDDLKVRWEELTAPDFVRAIARSGGTCVIPIGVIEKHGPQLPLGTDVLNVREVVTRAAQKEYAIVFPFYYFSQIFEAQHQPGTVAYSQELMWDVLQETCDELGRNGIKKIMLANGHGGNNSFLPYFCQSQLAKRKDYVVYLYQPGRDEEFNAQVKKMRKTTMEQHAGEMETSTVLAHRPDLVNLAAANSQSGEDLKRLTNIPNLYTGIWWYASFPNHYAGDAGPANAKLGEFSLEHSAAEMAKAIKAVKEDKSAPELQRRFFDQAVDPLKTTQGK